MKKMNSIKEDIEKELRYEIELLLFYDPDVYNADSNEHTYEDVIAFLKDGRQSMLDYCNE